MKNLKEWLRCLAAFMVGCAFFAANAQPPDFSGSWVGKTACAVGPVEFALELQDKEGTLVYDGYGPQKLYAASFPIKVQHRMSDMYVHFAGPDQGADFGSFAGYLLADGTIDNVTIKVNGQYCETFRLIRKAANDQFAAAPSFNAQGLNYENLVTLIMQGSFAAIKTRPDSSLFNSLYGSYLNAYARQCAADPTTRPKDFVEMTNLQCVEKRITTTQYRSGMVIDSAPYCTEWKDVPSGLFADPKMWEAKKKLDDVLWGDRYNALFVGKGTGLGLGGAAMPNPQQIAEAAATRAKDMEALVEMNGCHSAGLMRFQENFRLYALKRPFGTRPDGSTEPPILIPAPGTAFEDPNYVALLEELIKGEARSWHVNKYVLESIANPQISSRDQLGRPLLVNAQYRFGGMAGYQTGSMRVTFIEGYPECLYFSDKPDACRVPDKRVVSQYVHGAFAPQNAPAATPEDDPAAKEQKQRERAQAAEERRQTRERAREKSGGQAAERRR